MIKRKFFGKKVNGRFTLNDRNLYEEYLAGFQEGAELEMTLSKKFKRRTSGAPGEETNFNGYLFGVVLKIIGEEIGEMDLDDVHYWVQMAVGNIKVMPDGTKIPAGTSEKSGGEFAEYCSKIRIWAAIPKDQGGFIGAYIPEPHEVVYED